MKVFLDDVRDTPEGYVRAYWPEEVIALIQNNDVTEISLDHDLGDEENGETRPRTGYDVVLWLEAQVHNDPDFVMPAVFIHSANAVGVQKMRAGLKSIEAHVAER